MLHIYCSCIHGHVSFIFLVARSLQLNASNPHDLLIDYSQMKPLSTPHRSAQSAYDSAMRAEEEITSAVSCSNVVFFTSAVYQLLSVHSSLLGYQRSNQSHRRANVCRRLVVWMQIRM